MQNSLVNTKANILQQRIDLKLNQVKVVENEIDLTIDVSQKTVLETRAKSLWEEIDSIAKEIAFLESGKIEVSDRELISQGYISGKLPPANLRRKTTSIDQQIQYALKNLEVLPKYKTVPRPELLMDLVNFTQAGQLGGILLQGLPGSGKTVILSELVREIGNNYDLVFAIQFSGPSSIEPAYFLEKFNEFLNLNGLGFQPEIIQNQNYDNSIQILIDQVENIPSLIILDAVDQAPTELARNLIRTLSSYSNSQLVMSSRTRLMDSAYVRIYSVEPLSPLESQRFIQNFLDYTDIEIDSQSILNHLPKKIKEHPQGLSVFLSSLEDVPFELLIDKIEELDHGAMDLVKNMMTALEKSDLISLAFLIFLQEIDFVASMKSLNLEPPEGIVSSLKSLLIKSLIIRKEGSAYRVPVIVIDVFKEVDHRILDDVAGQIIKSIELRIGNIVNNEVVDRENENISVIAIVFQRLFELKYYTNLTTHITELFLEHINIRGVWKEYWLLLRLAFDSAKYVGDDTTAVRIGFRIARKSFQVREVEFGRKTLAEVNQFIDLNHNTIEKSEYLSHTALFLELDGDLKRSIENLLESLKIYRIHGDLLGEVIIEKLLGNVYLKNKDYVQARQYYEIALKNINEAKLTSKEIVEIMTSLALCDLAEGSLDVAEDRLRSSIQLSNDFGYLAGLPRAFYNLALVLRDLKKFDEALEYTDKVLELGKNTDQSIVVAASLLAWRLKKLTKLTEGKNEEY